MKKNALWSLISIVALAACSDPDPDNPCPGGQCPAGETSVATCSPPCGPNADCQTDQSCACAPGWTDCNADLAQAGGNGCECSTACNGTVCDTGPQSCSPTTVDDCGNAMMYCSNGTCARCQDGNFNCDGTQDCESAAPCLPEGKCEEFGTNTCGSQSQYCANETCTPCPAGTYNCDTKGGDCECTTGCDGTFCKQECSFETGCNDNTKYCDLGTCTPCPSGTFNCNGSGDCECSDGCDGTSCTGATACDYYDQNVCGGDTTQWCYENQCQSCTGGYFNCNGTKGCECDSQGCNGAQCAGQCSGGECP